MVSFQFSGVRALSAVLNSQMHCGSCHTLRSSKRFQDLGGGSERKKDRKYTFIKKRKK